MNSQTTNTTYAGGIGFTGLLAILFIALNLTGHIDWSWWWVTAPLWIPSVVVLILIAVGFMLLLGKEIRGLD
ncbi:MAG: hypothetical protein K5924_12625 [Chloroflexi bacterium]|nr:hypothetical protein [Chloroflexota bacterium]